MMNNPFAKGCMLFALIMHVSMSIFAHEADEIDGALLNKYEQQLHFIQNKGQWDANDMYRAEGFASTVQIRKDGFMLSVIDQEKLVDSYRLLDEIEEASVKGLPKPTRTVSIAQHAWMVKFVGMNPSAKVQSKFQDKKYYNYFIGNDKNKWASNVNSYEEVWYKNVYEKIDARLYAAEDLSLEYDMIVRPGGKVDDIKLAYEGLDGMRINQEGKLIINTTFGETEYPEPIAYQLVNGKRVSVKCDYTLTKDNVLGFSVGSYFKNLPLIIDPIALRWAVYVSQNATSGSGHNHGIEVDADEKLYVTGRLTATNFPTTTGAFQTTASGATTHGFVSKMDPPNGVNGAGSFIWSTYIAGSGNDNPYSIKLDAARNVYIVGVTGSTNFPTTSGAYDVTHNGGDDAFLTKISNDGTYLIYSTFIGGSGADNANFLYVTPSNEVYVAGLTPSSNFPTTTGAHQTTYGGGTDAFLCKFNTTGNTLLYSTFYGGSGNDQFLCLRPDGTNNLVAIGRTTSASGVATTGTFQPTISGTNNNGLIVKFNTSTNAFTWGTYINPIAGNSLILTSGQVDNGGNIYFGGYTGGVVPACLTTGAYDATYGGGTTDFYIGKLASNGASLVAGTYLGGSGNEVNLMGLNIDNFGKVYSFGYTTSNSPSLATTAYPLQASNNGGQDAIFFKMSADLSTMEYLSYWGGTANETDPIGFDGIKFSNCKAYTAMTTESNAAPMTRNGFQINKINNSISEPAVTVWANPPDMTVLNTITGNETVCYGALASDIIGSAPTFVLSDISRNGTITTQSVDPLVYVWMRSTDSINYTIIPAATSPNLTSAQIGPITQKTFFKREIGTDYCEGEAIVTKDVTIVPKPTIPSNINRPEIVCEKDTILLMAAGLLPGNNFHWTGPNGYDVTNANGTQLILNAQNVNEGVYIVTQVSPLGCVSAPDSIVVDVVICAPEAVADAATTAEDVAVSIPVLSNDTFGDDGPNTGSITITDVPSNGTVSVNDGGTPTDPTDDQIVYTPNANYNGLDTLIYEICDANNDCDTALVVITVTSVDDLPVANADAANTNEETPLSSTVVPNDVLSGDGGNTFNNACTICTTTSNGTLVFNNDGTYSYTPNANFNGTDQFIYELCDIDGDCDTALVTITVNPVNDPPIIGDTSVIIPQDSLITICLPFHDIDIMDTHTPSIACGPFNGTITSAPIVVGNTICLTYTPNNGYAGLDSICVVVCDNGGLCDTGIIHITVTPPRDTIIDTLCTTCTDTICLPNPFGAGSVVTTTLCDGSTSVSGTIVEATVLPNGCIEYIAKDIVGRDTLCIVQCDATSGLCDTTVIVVVVPPSPDTIYESVPVDSTLIVCVELETGMNPLTTTYSYCDGSTGTQTGTLGTAVLDNNGCVTYSAGSLAGIETPICVVACDATTGMCDTTTIIITVTCTPKFVTVNSASCNPADTGIVVEVLPGSNGCDSTVTTITTLLPSSDTLIVDQVTLCRGGSVTVGGQTFTEEGVYTIIIPNIHGCDSTITLDLNSRICDSIGIVLADTIRDTNYVNTIDTLCLTPLSGQIDDITIINCGFGNNSGNVYTVINNSCIEIDRSNMVGYDIDTLCVVACNNIVGICDTTTIIISNSPAPCLDILKDTTASVQCNGYGKGEYCLPLTMATMQDYDVYIDGTLTALQFTSESGCGTQVVTSGYGFQTIGYLENVSHLLESWSIDSTRTVYPNINFQTLDELVVYMNSVDTLGAWYVDGLNVRPGNSSDIYRSGSGIQYFASEPDIRTNYIPFSYNIGYSGAKLLIDTGCHVVKLVNKRTNCEDSMVICVESCPSQIILDTLPIRTTETICEFTTGRDGEVVTACDGATTGTTNLGSWSINAQGCLVYEAGPLKGNDTLCIKTCIGNNCFESTVIITVTGLPPVAINDSTGTDENTPVTIPVLDNDVQTDEDELALCENTVIVTSPSHGSVVVNDGTITYIPVTGYSGVDSFQYQICDPEGNDTAWVYITINGECQLPTVITPNGDGFNETFEVPCSSTSPVTFNVYNRWGIEVYKNEDYNNDFDGRYKGSPLPDGTYYYIVKYVNSLGEEIYKSSYLTIRR